MLKFLCFPHNCSWFVIRFIHTRSLSHTIYMVYNGPVRNDTQCLSDHNRHFTLRELVFFCFLRLFSHKVSLCPLQELWLNVLLIFCRRPWAYMLVHISNLELIGTGTSPDVSCVATVATQNIFVCTHSVFSIHMLSFRNGTHGPGMPCSNSPMVLCSRKEY